MFPLTVCCCVFVEPNAFHHALHRNVSATQLAADFRLLRAMLKDSPEFSGKFPRSVVVGPSTTRPKTKSLNYLSEYVCFIAAGLCCGLVVRDTEGLSKVPPYSQARLSPPTGIV